MFIILRYNKTTFLRKRKIKHGQQPYLYKYVTFVNPKQDEIANVQDLMITVYIYRRCSYQLSTWSGQYKINVYTFVTLERHIYNRTEKVRGDCKREKLILTRFHQDFALTVTMTECERDTKLSVKVCSLLRYAKS